MRVAGAAVLSDVESELEDEALRLQRATRGTASWRGTAAERARGLWVEQAAYLRRAAAALREARQALHQYEEVAAPARERLARAESELADVSALDELLDPTGVRVRAEQARAARTAAAAELEEAARRLAARLARLESEAGAPPAAAGPCAPPPPAPPATGWARAAEVVLGNPHAGIFDPVSCEWMPLLEAGSGGRAILRGLTRKQAEIRTHKKLIADAAADVLSNRANDHAFSHVDQLFGHKNISQAQRHEWARLIGAGLQSKKTFVYDTRHIDGVGHLHWQYDRYWVIVQHPVEGFVMTTFMPNASQLAAILRLIRH